MKQTVIKGAKPKVTDILKAARGIEYMPVHELKAAARNPKAHNEEDLDTSVRRFGFTEPVMLDERTGRLVAGHGRVKAVLRLQQAGEKPPDGVQTQGKAWLVPVVRGWASSNDRDAEAYVIASNQLTISGGWKDQELIQMLKELNAAEALEGVGFSDEELTALLNSAAAPGSVTGGEDEVPELPKVPYVQPGELYALGDHRILCGDCRKPEDVARLFGPLRAAVAVTSPPYASQREYDEKSGFVPIPADGFVAWYKPVTDNVLAHLTPDGSYFVNIKEHCEEGRRHLYVKDLTIAHVREWGWSLIDELVWVHTGTPGKPQRRFKNGWEPIFHFARTVDIKFRPQAVMHESDSAAATGLGKVSTGSNAKAQGKEGSGKAISEAAARSSAAMGGMAYPSNVLSVGKNTESLGHAAAFPVGLPEFCIRAYSDPQDVVFDPFMGSGTTLIAAERTGRLGLGMELSPAYAQLIIERWERYTGSKAVKAD